MPHPGKRCLTVSRLFFQGRAKPGSGILPVAVRDRPGKPQRLSRLIDGETAEQVKVSDLGRRGVFPPEASEQVVQRKDEVVVVGEGTGLIEQFDPHPPTTPLPPLPIPGMVDQDASHRFGGSGEEVSPAVEVLVADQPQVGFVHQDGGVEGVPQGFVSHLRGGELSQLVINERKDLGGSPTVAGGGGIQELGDLGHCGWSLTTSTRPSTPPEDDYRLRTPPGMPSADVLQASKFTHPVAAREKKIDYSTSYRVQGWPEAPASVKRSPSRSSGWYGSGSGSL
jgi:hypothetical protein